MIDLINDEGELGDERDALDEHDDNIANLAIRVDQLIDAFISLIQPSHCSTTEVTAFAKRVTFRP